jgi:small multidrug resistance pump
MEQVERFQTAKTPICGTPYHEEAMGTDWILLMGTILFEVAGTVAMKLSLGFAKLVPSILIFIFYGISFALLTLTLKTMHVSTVYALWSGLGTALVAVIGTMYFKETIPLFKAVGIGLVVLGVILINLHESNP